MYFTLNEIDQITDATDPQNGIIMPVDTPDEEDRLTRFMGLAWHELMHSHGYKHLSNDTPKHRQQVPHIYSMCMQRIATASTAQCNIPCSANEIAVITEFVIDNTAAGIAGSPCECVPDPAVPQSVTAERLPYDEVLDSFPVAIDGTGMVYRVQEKELV